MELVQPKTHHIYTVIRSTNMMLNTLTYNIAHFSSIEIAVLGILIALLNLRSLSLTVETKFLSQLRENLLLGIIPILLVSILVMINQLIAAIRTG